MDRLPVTVSYQHLYVQGQFCVKILDDLTPVQLTPWQERPLCKVAIMTKSTKSKTTPGGDPSPESRRHFDATFKQEVVALGKRIGISQAAKEMGGW